MMDGRAEGRSMGRSKEGSKLLPMVRGDIEMHTKVVDRMKRENKRIHQRSCGDGNGFEPMDGLINNYQEVRITLEGGRGPTRST